MTDYLKVNEGALPALTPRFLLLVDDGDDFLGLKPKATVRKPIITKIEESKEPEEAPMMISPRPTTSNKNKNNKDEKGGTVSENSPPFWTSLPRFDSIPAHKDCVGLPNIPARPLQDPSTPRPSKNAVSLFASFSQSPISREANNMWQYSTNCNININNSKSKLCHPLLSPLTTDAVGGDHATKAVEALWLSPQANQNHVGVSQQYKSLAIPNILPPIASSLILDDPHESSEDRPPSVIVYRITEPCVGGSFHNDNDDDEVSLLADDPDDDDEGVLPPSTYDVVVNILDEIDRDDNENCARGSKMG